MPLLLRLDQRFFNKEAPKAVSDEYDRSSGGMRVLALARNSVQQRLSMLRKVQPVCRPTEVVANLRVITIGQYSNIEVIIRKEVCRPKHWRLSLILLWALSRERSSNLLEDTVLGPVAGIRVLPSPSRMSL